LINETDNTEYPTVLCNCCSCCCVFLKAIAVYQQVNVVSKSRYFARIDPQACIACGACLERCHFAAIAQMDDGMVIDSQKCYGCGLCSSTCPSDAITLRMRDLQEIAPFNGGEFMKGMTKAPIHR
jgi:heterodisulfide reductase subunit A-like polyferredoxin